MAQIQTVAPKTKPIHDLPTWRTLEQHGRKIPDYLWEPIVRYVEQGKRPGVAA